MTRKLSDAHKSKIAEGVRRRAIERANGVNFGADCALSEVQMFWYIALGDLLEPRDAMRVVIAATRNGIGAAL